MSWDQPTDNISNIGSILSCTHAAEPATGQSLLAAGKSQPGSGIWNSIPSSSLNTQPYPNVIQTGLSRALCHMEAAAPTMPGGESHTVLHYTAWTRLLTAKPCQRQAWWHKVLTLLSIPSAFFSMKWPPYFRRALKTWWLASQVTRGKKKTLPLR